MPDNFLPRISDRAIRPVSPLRGQDSHLCRNPNIGLCYLEMSRVTAGAGLVATDVRRMGKSGLLRGVAADWVAIAVGICMGCVRLVSG